MKFGIANNVRSKVVRTCTPELFHKAIDSQVVAEVCAQIKDALEAVRRGEMTPEDFETLKGNLKKALIIFTFHATFKEGRRKNEDAIPSGLSIYDLDHIPNPKGRWAEIAPRKEELGIVLAHITPSSEGLRLVFVMPQGMDLEQAQAWMAKQLGDAEYDACVKDYARCSFAVPREYVLYQSEALFNEESIDNEELRMKNEELPSDGSVLSNVIFRTESSTTRQSEAKNLEGTNASTHVDAPEILRRSAPLDDKNEGGCTHELPSGEGDGGVLEYTQANAEVNGNHTPLSPLSRGEEPKPYAESFKGTPYATIIQEWFRRNGGEPEVGERNSKLHRLASHLRYITDNNEEHLLQILPRYGLKEEEMRQLIHSACVAKFYGIPKSLQKLISDLEQEHEQEKSKIINQSEADSQVPPEMPKKLPPLIKLLVSKTPKIYQPAVAHAVFPALGAHLWRTYFRYVDNVEHEATLMNVLMAGTGAGKNCISEPINHIIKDIRIRDKENLQREKEWKKEMQTKGANKDKRQRPEGLVIQEIDPDTTNAAFVQRLADTEERFLYTKMNEIDQFDALKTSAHSKAHFQIMCLAFDPGNVYGQTRVGTGSVSERVCIRFNWNASTTIRKGQSYFQSVLTDGPISRINFCTIPERPIGAEMPIYGTYDANFEEELRPYIERLNKARGRIECKQARALSRKLIEECADFARLSESRVYENLSFRANVIAFLKACILYVAHGERWDKTMEEFIRWSLKYDLWCKMRFFGEAIEKQEYGVLQSTRKGPQNLLELLPDTFTREEAGQMRQQQGIRRGSLSAMLSNWKSRKYIVEVGEVPEEELNRQLYTKTEEYLQKHPRNQ